MPSARFQSIADGSKPKPRSNNQTPKSLPVSKSSCVTITAIPKADHSKRKLFDSCTSKDDSEPTLGLNVDISNIHESKQTLDLSAELESLFGPLFDEYLNGENQVVSKSSAVTTADASDKRQQQPDSTSSTSTLATIVTANGNFDL
ncbi:hypothetical protein Tco_0606272 [Tanacetum coccineum]